MVQALSGAPGPRRVRPPAVSPLEPAGACRPLGLRFRLPRLAGRLFCKRQIPGSSEDHVRKQQIGAWPGVRDVPGLNHCQLLWDVGQGGGPPAIARTAPN